LLTSVGVQRTALGPRRNEMLPPLPSTYWRIQSLRPAEQISFLMAWAWGEEKIAFFGVEPGERLAGGVGGRAGFSGPARPGVLSAAFLRSVLHFLTSVPKDILGRKVRCVEKWAGVLASLRDPSLSG